MYRVFYKNLVFAHYTPTRSLSSYRTEKSVKLTTHYGHKPTDRHEGKKGSCISKIIDLVLHLHALCLLSVSVYVCVCVPCDVDLASQSKSDKRQRPFQYIYYLAIIVYSLSPSIKL